MAVEIIIPSPGESITEVTLGPWRMSSGDWVEKDQPIVEIESDKVTLEIVAPESGLLHVLAEEGAELEVGDVIGRIDPAGRKPSGDGEVSSAAPPAAEAPAAPAPPQQASRATSVARKLASEKGVDLSGIPGTGAGGRVTKSDVLAAAEQAPAPPPAESTAPAPVPQAPAPAAPAPPPGSRGVRRDKITKLRQRIAERLVEAQHHAATLTTFNEVDMTEVMRLRNRHRDDFEKKHGVRLGFMSFFTRACVSALQAFPRVNAYIVGSEIEYHDYVDLSVAVGTPKGLVVPVLRNAEAMSFADIELGINNLATRARDGQLTIEEMTGGTFTISNGGIYGSLNSTPILNPPQSAILGLHKIQKRPVEDPDNPGQIALRPMMNLALSYDHRIVDGEQAVSFLVHVRNCIGQPERILLDL